MFWVPLPLNRVMIWFAPGLADDWLVAVGAAVTVMVTVDAGDTVGGISVTVRVTVSAAVGLPEALPHPVAAKTVTATAVLTVIVVLFMLLHSRPEGNAEGCRRLELDVKLRTGPVISAGGLGQSTNPSIVDLPRRRSLPHSNPDHGEPPGDLSPDECAISPGSPAYGMVQC